MKYAPATFMALYWMMSGTHGQIVQRGATPITPEYCLQDETIRPNFSPTHDVVVHGRITDQVNVPLQKSSIELRRYVSEQEQVTVKKISTDSDGKFDLGLVRAGGYRLLLSPHRGFKQPDKLQCSSSKDCTINAVLVVNSSDGPAAGCPIR